MPSYNLCDLPVHSVLSENIAHEAFDVLVKFELVKDTISNRGHFIGAQSVANDIYVEYTLPWMGARFWNNNGNFYIDTLKPTDNSLVNAALAVVFDRHCDEIAKKMGLIVATNYNYMIDVETGPEALVNELKEQGFVNVDKNRPIHVQTYAPNIHPAAKGFRISTFLCKSYNWKITQRAIKEIARRYPDSVVQFAFIGNCR